MNVTFTLINPGKCAAKDFPKNDPYKRQFYVKAYGPYKNGGVKHTCIYEGVLIIDVDGITKVFHSWNYGKGKCYMTPEICREISCCAAFCSTPDEVFTYADMVIVGHTKLGLKQRHAIGERMRRRSKNKIQISF